MAIHELHSSNSLIRFAFSSKSVWLWIYGVIYGLICIATLYLFVLGKDPELSSASMTDAQESSGYPVLLYAVLIGMCTKSVLAVTFVKIPFEGKSFPLGPATFLQVFEPQLCKKIDEDNIIEMDKFLAEALSRNAQLSVTEIHERIRTKLTTRGQTPEVSGFLMDLAGTQTPRDAFALYLKVWDVKLFRHTFFQ